MIGRERGCFSRFSCFSWVALFAFLTLGLAPSVRAETVEIAPGVQVTKRSYAAPINEQPFFGFADKTAAQREADDKFVKALLQAVGTREKALDETTKRGWRALASGKPGEAALRFNQAYLVSPEQSRVYHGLAAIAQTRFNDLAFAEELFRIAQKQPNPLKMLNADYGRRASDREAAKGGAAGAGAGGQGRARLRRRLGQSRPCPAAKRRPRRGLRGGGRSDDSSARPAMPASISSG